MIPRYLLFVILFYSFSASAQPYIEEIQEFKKQDSISFPPRNSNLFIGSSTIRMWESLQDDFPCYKVINRGFGGSTLPDVIRYVNDIIFPYNPKQVIIYCGENDLANSDTISSQTVLSRFRELFSLIRDKWKNVHIVYISIKPSPSRIHLLPKMMETNTMIKEFLSGQRRSRYIDVFNLMLDQHGNPNKDLFLEDDLHMNAKGYAIWKKALMPVMKK